MRNKINPYYFDLLELKVFENNETTEKNSKKKRRTDRIIDIVLIKGIIDIIKVLTENPNWLSLLKWLMEGELVQIIFNHYHYFKI